MNTIEATTKTTHKFPTFFNFLKTSKLSINKQIAYQISKVSAYCDEFIQLAPLPFDTLQIFDNIKCKVKKEITSSHEIEKPRESINLEYKRLFFLNGNLNYDFDIQELLLGIKKKICRSDRLVFTVYNPYFSILYKITSFLKIRHPEEPQTFITTTDIENIAKISQFEIVRSQSLIYFPFHLFGIGKFINSVVKVIPILNLFSLVQLIYLRPLTNPDNRPSLSIIIPARNEKGNIENAITRLPDFQTEIEIIFIEGHSKDETWEEIKRVKEHYNNKYKIKAFQQTGVGKNDAVRLGFSEAENDLLVILDADLTMPPEQLTRFYEAYVQGQADFINGSRLVYPMEGEAMRFLNKLGNKFFAKSLSYVLSTKLGDSLCGTKLVSRSDYKRFSMWRDDFGDFDPFGDFELLFPASLMALGITDIPIRYRARTYGSTQISRFKHGLILLKMTIIGFLKIKLD